MVLERAKAPGIRFALVADVPNLRRLRRPHPCVDVIDAIRDPAAAGLIERPFLALRDRLFPTRSQPTPSS